ncbi:prolyl hydroxylase family protein [Sphingomonas sp. HMP6]|uniref:prolyl hydroxylase family protein n=1 Tax=Sphingomonas sp. HMP6 TaxID=1517551 RepID=UPI003FA6FF1F
MMHPLNLGSGHPSEAVVDHILAQSGVQRVPSPKLTLFIRRHFLDAETCAAICAAVDATRRPSTVADFNGDPTYRTSETGDLPPDDPLTITLNEKITAFTGLDPLHGEPIQGQRYAVGQEFKQHTDYFEPNGPDFDKFCSVAGNRTWTVMIYLNTPEAGGATRFKTIDKIVQPELGKLLAWNNRRPDGTLNPATMHHGMKVRAGTKYVVTKWFRERPWGWAS